VTQHHLKNTEQSPTGQAKNNPRKKKATTMSTKTYAIKTTRGRRQEEKKQLRWHSYIAGSIQPARRAA